MTSRQTKMMATKLLYNYVDSLNVTQLVEQYPDLLPDLNPLVAHMRILQGGVLEMLKDEYRRATSS